MHQRYISSTLSVFLVFHASLIIADSTENRSTKSKDPADATTIFTARANVLTDVLVTCQFDPLLGLFNDLVWQSGSGLETLSDVISQADSNAPLRWTSVLSTMYSKLPAVIDNCFDDHQWFLLGWARAYEATKNVSYLERATTIFDFVSTNGWETTVCRGGVTWCPPPTGIYKNAITSELFFASAMALAPYESIIGKPNGYYTSWATKVWTWLEASGMLNSNGLFNDGLNSGTCLNNGQTTWTYNQGVVLSALGRLSIATSNATLLTVAERIGRAAMANLSVDGILTEPCAGGNCNNDQRIFKGVFVRHLAILANLASPAFKAEATSFLATNAAALSRNGAGGCPFAGASFPIRWDGPCDSSADVATTAAALDAFAAAAKVGASAPSPTSSWVPLGFGNCADSTGASMANCNAANVLDERACRDAAWITPGAIAYDFSFSDCLGGTFCRVRTLAGPSACNGNFVWVNGTASTVTTTVDGLRSICVIRV
jgi:hypothetical protein